MHAWLTSRRSIPLDRTVIMGVLNVTPDSFSDGGEYLEPEAAIRRAEAMIAEGADILDIGGESTRPGSTTVAADDEVRRVVPVIEAIAKRFDVPVSVDTSKSAVAAAALGAGAEIVNDISGLRWDAQVAAVAAASGAGLVLMHSRGEFDTMHSQPPAEDIMKDLKSGLRRSVEMAGSMGVERSRIAIDIGIGFGKTADQNLELLGRLDEIIGDFEGFPVVVGTSRKSFIGRISGDTSATERLGGSLATAALAAWLGAAILRVHDVRETVQAARIIDAVKRQLD
jgi:dihydropteroate synthase